MKKHNINITNHTTIEAYGTHTKANSKKVYIVELDMVCISMTDAAEVIGCSLDAVSNVIRGKQQTAYGYHIIDLSKAGEEFTKLVTCMPKANMHHKKKSEPKLSRQELREFRKWKAERKAEERKQKRKAKYEAKKVKLQAKIERHKSLAEKHYAKGEEETRKQMKAEQMLEALMDKEVL